MKTILRAGVLASLLAAACASQTKLQPAPGATKAPTVPGGATVSAEARGEGIRVVANPSAWPSGSDVRDHLLPVKLTIENTSRDSLIIRYKDIKLVGGAGSWASLPPFRLSGPPAGQEVGAPPDHRVIAAPEFEAKDFSILSPYASVYPGLTVKAKEMPGSYDDNYVSNYYPLWRQIKEDYPTMELQQMALPEGILEPGGHVSGFVYFPKVEVGEHNPYVALVVEISRASDGQVLQKLSIPFQKAD